MLMCSIPSFMCFAQKVLFIALTSAFRNVPSTIATLSAPNVQTLPVPREFPELEVCAVLAEFRYAGGC